MALDIDERHLLRLGHGEEALETEKDFSRYGRVNYVLAKRLDLLQEVQRLQESLKVPGDAAYTCETAGYFYTYHILSRWEKFLSSVQPVEGIVSCFVLQVSFLTTRDVSLPLGLQSFVCFQQVQTMLPR